MFQKVRKSNEIVCDAYMVDYVRIICLQVILDLNYRLATDIIANILCRGKPRRHFLIIYASCLMVVCSSKLREHGAQLKEMIVAYVRVKLAD